jgi:hypothetical protein
MDQGALVEPIAVPNPFLWYDTSDASSVGLNGLNMARLDDKGSGFNAIQSNPTFQPPYILGAQNGKNVARFSSSVGHFLSAALPATLPQPNTFFVVVKLNNLAEIMVFFDLQLGPNRNLMAKRNIGNKIVINAGIDMNGALDFGNSARLHTAIFDGVNSQIYLDRIINPGGAGGAGVLDGGAQVLIGGQFAGGGFKMDGDFCEARVYQGILTTPELEATWDQMIPKWGI